MPATPSPTDFGRGVFLAIHRQPTRRMRPATLKQGRFSRCFSHALARAKIGASGGGNPRGGVRALASAPTAPHQALQEALAMSTDLIDIRRGSRQSGRGGICWTSKSLSAEEITHDPRHGRGVQRGHGRLHAKDPAAGRQDLRQPVLRDLDPHPHQLFAGRPAAGGRHGRFFVLAAAACRRAKRSSTRPRTSRPWASTS